MSFSSLGLSPELLNNIATNNYESATPIQKEAIPFILKGKDILGIDDTTIQSGNGYSNSYSWSSLFVTNSFAGFSGNGDNTAPNLTQVSAITTT